MLDWLFAFSNKCKRLFQHLFRLYYNGQTMQWSGVYGLLHRGVSGLATLITTDEQLQ